MSFIFLLSAFAFAPGQSPSQDPEALARRIATIASIAADEYALGVDGGQVVSDAELTEARLFFGEARDAAADLPVSVRREAVARLDSLLARAVRLDHPASLRADVDDLRRVLAAGLGIQLDPLPNAAPSLAAGEQLYRAACGTCHGDRGAGDGPAAAGLDPPPADLTDREALRGSSPLDFFRKISVGIAGTAMTGYETQFTPNQRWALAQYTTALRATDQDRRAGATWLAEKCGECPIWLSDFAGLAGVSDDSLSLSLANAAGEQAPTTALDFARTASAAEVLGSDRTLAVHRVAERAAIMIGEVESLAAAGDPNAAQSRALEAYLAFEAIESLVGARNAGAVRDVERAFADLRADAGAGRDVGTRAEGARRALGRAVEVATAQAGGAVLFGQSLLIILREGLEAILIVGALVAVALKAGAPRRVREIGLGVLVAIVASLATAAAFASFLSVTAAQQEAIEGVTMLVASVVLFSVASWMVSKIEAEKWRAFVEAKMRDALRGGGLALAGVAFLAVYREGFETVLFYAALLGSAEHAAGRFGILAGFLVGAAVLVALYVAIQRWGLRIPLRPFFAVTGILLTVMAVSFAGQGVAELQEAGWVPATPIALPAIPALGLFPTVQTLTAQLVFAAGFLAALAWIFWLGPRPAPGSVRR
jgi:high-affinity iron transporter